MGLYADACAARGMSEESGETAEQASSVRVEVGAPIHVRGRMDEILSDLRAMHARVEKTDLPPDWRQSWDAFRREFLSFYANEYDGILTNMSAAVADQVRRYGDRLARWRQDFEGRTGSKLLGAPAVEKEEKKGMSTFTKVALGVGTLAAAGGAWWLYDRSKKNKLTKKAEAEAAAQSLIAAQRAREEAFARQEAEKEQFFNLRERFYANRRPRVPVYYGSRHHEYEPTDEEIEDAVAREMMKEGH